jgi:hypothetical protein
MKLSAALSWGVHRAMPCADVFSPFRASGFWFFLNINSLKGINPPAQGIALRYMRAICEVFDPQAFKIQPTYKPTAYKKLFENVL